MRLRVGIATALVLAAGGIVYFAVASRKARVDISAIGRPCGDGKECPPGLLCRGILEAKKCKIGCQGLRDPSCPEATTCLRDDMGAWFCERR